MWIDARIHLYDWTTRLNMHRPLAASPPWKQDCLVEVHLVPAIEYAVPYGALSEVGEAEGNTSVLHQGCNHTNECALVRISA